MGLLHEITAYSTLLQVSTLYKVESLNKRTLRRVFAQYRGGKKLNFPQCLKNNKNIHTFSVTQSEQLKQWCLQQPGSSVLGGYEVRVRALAQLTESSCSKPSAGGGVSFWYHIGLILKSSWRQREKKMDKKVSKIPVRRQKLIKWFYFHTYKISRCPHAHCNVTYRQLLP